MHGGAQQFFAGGIQGADVFEAGGVHVGVAVQLHAVLEAFALAVAGEDHALLHSGAGFALACVGKGVVADGGDFHV